MSNKIMPSIKHCGLEMTVAQRGIWSVSVSQVLLAVTNLEDKLSQSI